MAHHVSGAPSVASVFLTDLSLLLPSGARVAVSRADVPDGPEVQVDGVTFPNALCLFPSSHGTAQASFEVKAVCHRLVAMAAIMDDVTGDADDVVFAVVTDGVERWRSRPVSTRQVSTPHCTCRRLHSSLPPPLLTHKLPTPHSPLSPHSLSLFHPRAPIRIP